MSNLGKNIYSKLYSDSLGHGLDGPTDVAPVEVFKSFTGSNGDKVFQIKNGEDVIFQASRLKTSAAYPATSTIETMTGQTPTALTDWNNYDGQCRSAHSQATLTSVTSRAERYDDLNLASALNMIAIMRETATAGTYVFGDLTIQIHYSSGRYAMSLTDATNGLIGRVFWGRTGTGSGTSMTWAVSGVAPSHVVAVPRDTGTQALATTRTSNSIGTSSSAINHRLVNNGFLATKESEYIGFYSKGAYTSGDGVIEVETVVGGIIFKLNGDPIMVMGGYQNNSGSTGNPTITFPVTHFSGEFPTFSMCTGAANRKVCMQEETGNTTQVRYKTWDRTASSAQGLNIVSMDIRGDA
jgi:hypothetical protein